MTGAGDKTARMSSVRRLQPSPWEHERAAFVERMKGTPISGRKTLDGLRKDMAECFAAKDLEGAEKVISKAGLPPWQHLILLSDYNAGCGNIEDAARCMAIALDGQDSEHNGAPYVANLITLGDLRLKVREPSQRDGDSAGDKEARNKAKESYLAALKQSGDLPDGGLDLQRTARDRLLRLGEAELRAAVAEARAEVAEVPGAQ